MNRKLVDVIVLSMVLTLVMSTACARAEFEPDSLAIAPSTVGTGETATIKVSVANVGAAEGTYTAALTIDGVPVETKDVTVPAGATEAVTFSVVKEVVGVYEVEVGGLTGTLNMVKPAEFLVTNVTVQPAEAQPKQAVTISVSVANTGDMEGSYTVVLKINTLKEAEKTVPIAAGASEIVTFSVTREESDSYSITVDGLSGNFYVVAPSPPPAKTPPPTPTPSRGISESLIAQIDYSSWVASSVTVSPDSTRMAYVAKVGNEWCVAVDGEEGKRYDNILRRGEIIFDSPNSLLYFALKGNRVYLVEERIE